MNPSTAQAAVMVDELVRNGVRHAVLAPGSRNAPFAFALHEAARAGRLELHVRVDERSAGYLALGLAARLSAPVVLVCTSGTAAANLHPAVEEAFHAGVPLVVLTADRPRELRAAGANQTIDQNRLYGSAVRWCDELAVAEDRPGSQAYWRSQVARACQVASGDRRGAPVHVNVPLREPLVPDGDPDWCESLAGRSDGGPWTRFGDTDRGPAVLGSELSRRGIVVAADDRATGAASWARSLGWPLLSETGGAGGGGTNAVATGMWLLNLPGFLDEHRPDQVLCVGRPTVFRQTQRLLADRSVEVLLVHGDADDWPAPAHDVTEVAETLGLRTSPSSDPDWLTAWQQADHKASAALHAALDLEHWPSGPGVARDVVDALPTGALFTVSSSNPARDVALAARQRDDIVVHRNRGVAGIDGLVSTAIGAAIAHGGPAYALLGDLSFVHDSNGLLIGPDDERPDLTLVVFNDDGGGIFSLLEQGEPEHRATFERVFGTPHGTDLGALCAAHGVDHTLVWQSSELVEALRPRSGLRVVEVRTDRERLRGVHARLTAAVRSAVLGRDDA